MACATRVHRALRPGLLGGRARLVFTASKYCSLLYSSTLLSPPTFWKGLPGPWGRPDPQIDHFLICRPIFCYFLAPFWRL